MAKLKDAQLKKLHAIEKEVIEHGEWLQQKKVADSQRKEILAASFKEAVNENTDALQKAKNAALQAEKYFKALDEAGYDNTVKYDDFEDRVEEAHDSYLSDLMER